MDEVYKALLNAIRDKCQRDRWYGPDCLSPRRYDGALERNSRFSRSTLAQLDPHDPSNFGFAFPPASEVELVETEEKLGFALPPLLRVLYAKLANGGFGPQVGIRGALHGYSDLYPDYDGTILGLYPGRPPFGGESSLIELQALEHGALVPYEQWPRELLQICDVGCCTEICLGPDSRIYQVASSKRADCYLFMYTQWTFEEWLWRWVKGENIM